VQDDRTADAESLKFPQLDEGKAEASRASGLIRLALLGSNGYGGLRRSLRKVAVMLERLPYEMSLHCSTRRYCSSAIARVSRCQSYLTISRVMVNGTKDARQQG